MSAYRLAIKFFLILLVVYGVFLVPYPRFDSELGFLEYHYGRGFAAATDYLSNTVWLDENGKNVQGILGTPAVVRVLHIPSNRDRFKNVRKIDQRDIKLLLVNFNNRAATGLRTSSRHLGYMPAVVLIALIVASPVRLLRKSMALVIGLILINLFVLLRVAMIFAFAFQGNEKHSIFVLGAPWARVFVEAYNIIAVVPATAYVVPVFVWLLVTFGRADRERIWQTLRPAGDKTTSPCTDKKPPDVPPQT